MAANDTPTMAPAAPAAPEAREITLNYDGCDWIHHVKEPNEAQAVQIVGLTEARGISDPNATDEQKAVYARRAVGLVQTAAALAQGLHADPDEWRRLANSMARGTATAAVMYDVILGALRAWDDEPQEENRATKRAAAKKARRAPATR